MLQFSLIHQNRQSIVERKQKQTKKHHKRCNHSKNLFMLNGMGGHQTQLENITEKSSRNQSDESSSDHESSCTSSLERSHRQIIISNSSCSEKTLTDEEEAEEHAGIDMIEVEQLDESALHSVSARSTKKARVSRASLVLDSELEQSMRQKRPSIRPDTRFEDYQHKV